MHENMKCTNVLGIFKACLFLSQSFWLVFLNLTIRFWNLAVSAGADFSFFSFLYLFIYLSWHKLICAHRFFFHPPSCTNMVCKESLKPSASMSEGSYISVLCLHTRKCSINMAQHGYPLYMGTRLKTIPFAHAQLGSDGGAHCWGRWRSC